MDEGGVRKNEIRTELRTHRRIKYQFQGAGAHPWLLDRRSGPARGIYNRLLEDDRFPSRQMPSEAQRCLNIMMSVGGVSAYQMVFRSNLVDLLGWDDRGEDLVFAHDTSVAGRFAQQWQLRLKAQEATLKEIAKSKLRRLLAYEKSFN